MTGAGTTGASLRAGVPTIVTPFALDQFGWSKIVADLGVGPKAIPAKKLTAEKLAAAIQAAVTDQAIRDQVTALGKKIQAEDGIAQALALKLSLVPPEVMRLTKKPINRTYEIMGLFEALKTNIDYSSVLHTADIPELAEFERIIEEQGLKAALMWRESRYS